MKYCNKCGTRVKKDKSFCHKCGNELSKRFKLIEKITHHEKDHICSKFGIKNPIHATFCAECGHSLGKKLFGKTNYKFSKWHMVYLILVVLAIVLLPTKVESYPDEVPYEDLEEYVIQVPYETTESYVESVPVEEEEEYQDVESYTDYEPYTVNKVVNSNYCNLRSGCSCIARNWWTGVCYQCNCEEEDYLEVQKSNVVTKYRPVTIYKDVIKTQQVTKYRDETKYRKVTKIRTETKYKEVNWLFGFDAIVKFRDLSKYG